MWKWWLVLTLALAAVPMPAAGGNGDLSGVSGFDLLVVYANPYHREPDQAREALRTGALEKLRTAGLPVLDRAEAEKIPGRPRLVVLIGVIPQPICGPSDLYEIEVRLEEDCIRQRPPAENVRCESWKFHTHGLTVDPDEEWPDLVEHALYNVDGFIEAFQAANP